MKSRRRIACPRLGPTPRRDYSKDRRPTEWGSGIILVAAMLGRGPVRCPIAVNLPPETSSASSVKSFHLAEITVPVGAKANLQSSEKGDRASLADSLMHAIENLSMGGWL
jgi:hypothetical protein